MDYAIMSIAQRQHPFLLHMFIIKVSLIQGVLHQCKEQPKRTKRVQSFIGQLTLQANQDYNTVMLSNYLKSKQAHYSIHQQQLTLSYTRQSLEIGQVDIHYRSVRILSLTHCGLTSLRGIQQFLQLEQLNVRGNRITQVQELMRITNKQLIQRLEFTGNDIEYLGAALFINLQPHFPNLIELNGKNYHALLHRSSNRHQMKNILARSHQIHNQMLKTLRKEHRKTKQLKNNDDGCTVGLHTEQKVRTQDPYPLHSEDDENDYAKHRDNIGTSKRRQQSHRSPSPARSRPSPQGHQEKENLNSSNQHQYDVSLGDISNIPMTKSIQGSYLPTSKHSMRKGLEIFTLNESPMARAPLSQPTATFAMQRQKAGEAAMFRNPERTQKYHLDGVLIEEGTWKEDEGRPTKRETRQSASDEESWDSSLCDNIIHEDKSSNQLKKIQVAGALFTKNLVERVFNAWRHLPPEKNFPVKRHFA